MNLIIDNYDSFTYNIAQALRQLSGEPVKVVRNDAMSAEELAALRPVRLVISSGPGQPRSAGVSVDAVRFFAGRVPILGISLGMLVVGEAFGARVVRAPALEHGKVREVTGDGAGVFRGMKGAFKAICYNSLTLDGESLPVCMVASAADQEGGLMGIRHSDFPVEGVLFHPDSIMTPMGKRVFRNFLGQG